MKKVITESQIRFVVRNELKNYLVQEGLWDTIKTGISKIGSQVSAAVKKTDQQITSNEAKQVLQSLNYLEVPQAQQISQLLNKLKTESYPNADFTDPQKIITQLIKLIDDKITKQTTELTLESRLNLNEATPPASTTPRRSYTRTTSSQPSEAQILKKLYMISVARKNDANNEVNNDPKSPDVKKHYGELFAYTVCELLIQNLVNPALGTDILSKNQQAKIKDILTNVDNIFKNPTPAPPAAATPPVGSPSTP